MQVCVSAVLVVEMLLKDKKVSTTFVSRNGIKDDRVKMLKVSNGAKIRNRYNQVPHLTQDKVRNRLTVIGLKV